MLEVHLHKLCYIRAQSLVDVVVATANKITCRTVGRTRVLALVSLIFQPHHRSSPPSTGRKKKSVLDLHQHARKIHVVQNCASLMATGDVLVFQQYSSKYKYSKGQGQVFFVFFGEHNTGTMVLQSLVAHHCPCLGRSARQPWSAPALRNMISVQYDTGSRVQSCPWSSSGRAKAPS